MKEITDLKRIIFVLFMVMGISAAMSFIHAQKISTPEVKPPYHEECEYFIGTLTYSVTALKGATYQWYTAPYRSTTWTAIKGATSNILTLTFAKGEFVRDLNRKQYKCKVTPLLGFPVDSDIAYLYVLIKPSVTGQPAGATKYVGESVTFSISASGSTPRYYQWQFNSGAGYSDISGATSTSYTIPTIAMENAGDYRCKVTNDCGYTYSTGATLTVLEPLFSDGWFAQSSGTSKDIRQISAISEYNAWVVTSETDMLLHTNDGGDTWNTVYMVDAGALALNYYGYCIRVTNTNNVYVGGYNGYAYTTNGGTIWAKKDVKTAIGLGAGDYFYTNDIFFYNTSIGWIVGSDGLIAYTADGGTNWTKQNWAKDPDKVTDADLRCVYFYDASNGWIGGTNGVILMTTNGGADWVLQSAPETQTILDIDFVTATKGFAVSSYYRSLYITENGGSNWNKYSGTLPTFYPYALDFVNTNTGWMAGYGYQHSAYSGSIMRTNDGGNT